MCESDPQLSGRTESCHEYIIYQETKRADDTHSKPLQTSHLHSSPEWPRRKAVDLQLRTPSAQTLFQGSQRKNATSAFCWEGWRLRWKQRCRSPAVCTLCPRGSGPRLWTLRSPVWFRSRCGWEASQHRQRSPLWLWARHRPKSHLNHLLETDTSKWGGAKIHSAVTPDQCHEEEETLTEKRERGGV